MATIHDSTATGSHSYFSNEPFSSNVEDYGTNRLEYNHELYYKAFLLLREKGCILDTGINTNFLSYFKCEFIDNKSTLHKDLAHIFSNVAKIDRNVRNDCFSVASAFDSFGIENAKVYYTGDSSILFELFYQDSYFSLELFADGDIVTLRRVGRGESLVFDINSEDLYSAVNSIYDDIHKLNNVQ